MKLLAVDDDKACLEVLHSMCVALGHEVIPSNDPRAALLTFSYELNAGQPFDAVLTDFQMPVWSGITLAMQIKNVCTYYEIKVPVICLTGNRVSDVAAMNLRDGSPIALIIGKPYSKEDVENALKAVTERV